MSLPAWVTDSKEPATPRDLLLCEAFSIAWEALEKTSQHWFDPNETGTVCAACDGGLHFKRGDPTPEFHDATCCYEIAKEALRRIESLGVDPAENIKKAGCVCGKKNCGGHPEGRFP